MTLRDLHPGDKAVVISFLADSAYRRRIVAMGITKGTEITMVKAAPLGDPIEVMVRGYQLSLRKDEASCIEVSNC
jgi:ferrous iron transport protein A